MFHVYSKQFYRALLMAFGLVVIGLTVFAVAQSKKEERKPKLSEVLVREGKSGVRLKDPSKFEIVKQGESGGVVQFKTSKETLGSFGCGSCAGQNQACLFFMNPTGRGGTCGGSCPAKDCTLNPF